MHVKISIIETFYYRVSVSYHFNLSISASSRWLRSHAKWLESRNEMRTLMPRTLLQIALRSDDVKVLFNLRHLNTYLYLYRLLYLLFVLIFLWNTHIFLVTIFIGVYFIAYLK